MPIVSANGIDFHVQTMGDGPPLVLLHGLLLGSMASWYFSAAPELAKHHRVILYDLRGHGRTARCPGGFDLATQCDDLAALLAALSIDPGEISSPLSLCGHSFGALIALRFALAHPERVTRLALVEAPLPPSRFDELMLFLSRTPYEMLAALPVEARSLFAKPGRQADRLVASLSYLAGATTLLRDLAAERDIPDAELATLRSETLCVYGTQSSCAPVGERLARVLPRASLVRVPGGHFLPSENARGLTAVLAEFFRG